MYDGRRLSTARKLLTGDVNGHTEVSLFGFTLRREAGRASVWTVYDDGREAPVDYIDVSACSSATELLGHLERLRDAKDRDFVEVFEGP